MRIMTRISYREENVYPSDLNRSRTLANLITVQRSPLPVKSNFSKAVDFCLLNVRSVNNKSFVVKDFVVDNNIDIPAMTETWLRAEMVDMNIINSLCPTGYDLYHLPRIESRGGGVAVLYKKSFKLKKLSLGVPFKSFEFTDCIMNYSSASVRLVVIYKPGLHLKRTSSM